MLGAVFLEYFSEFARIEFAAVEIELALGDGELHVRWAATKHYLLFKVINE
jgi:hypothetical protein